MLGSIGHSPSHALQRDSPLLEGAKAVVRLPYAETGGGRKASPGGEAGSPQGLTDEVEATDDHHALV